MKHGDTIQDHHPPQSPHLLYRQYSSYSPPPPWCVHISTHPFRVFSNILTTDRRATTHDTSSLITNHFSYPPYPILIHRAPKPTQRLRVFSPSRLPPLKSPHFHPRLPRHTSIYSSIKQHRHHQFPSSRSSRHSTRHLRHGAHATQNTSPHPARSM